MSDLRLVPASLVVWLAALLLLPAPAPARLAVGLAAGGLALAAAATRRPGQVLLVPLALAALCLSLAGQDALRRGGDLERFAQEHAIATVEGTVRGDPRRGTAGVRAELAVDRVEAAGATSPAAARVLVTGDEAWLGARHGERVRARVRLAPAGRGEEVLARARAIGPPQVLRPAGAVDRGVERLREGLRRVSEDLPPDARGLVPGLAVGDTSRLDPVLAQAMRDASLTHVTAVSGAHFAVLGTAVGALLGLLRAPRPVRVAVVVLVTVGFVLLVRPEPSVLRAAAMGLVGALGLVLGRPSQAVAALCTTVLALLLVDPWLARSYGFVLSALATAGLVVLTRPLATRLEVLLPAWLARALAVPLAAQLACAPVLVLLAPVVSLVGVPANVLAAPALVPGTVLGVLATVAAPWWPGAAGVLAAVAGWACSWIALVARIAAAQPWALLPWPEGPPGALLLAALVLLALLLGRWRPRLLLAALLCAGLLLAPVGRRLLSPVPADWTVALCDVGQGTSLVVRSGPASAVLVDVGPADGRVGACLDRLGVRTIDLLALTHFHADHVDGLPGALAGRTVREALVTPLREPQHQARAALELLRGVPVEEGRAGMAGAAGAVRWRLLWPAAPVPLEPNDASLVLWLRAPGVRVLALGDLETEAQEALARRLAAQGLRRPAEVVVMAHHGSARQSARLAELLDPAVLLVGVGEGNPYGHPAPEGLARYPRALVLRTDECGTVVLAPRGRSRCGWDVAG